MVDDDKSSVCGRVVDFLNSRGIKAAQAAKEMGVTRAAVSAMVRGKVYPSIPCLRWLCSKGADVNYILSGVGRGSPADELLAYVSDRWCSLTTEDKIQISVVVQKAANGGG